MTQAPPVYETYARRFRDLEAARREPSWLGEVRREALGLSLIHI